MSEIWEFDLPSRGVTTEYEEPPYCYVMNFSKVGAEINMLVSTTFCRVHSTLKSTPAQASGLTTETWSLDRLLAEADRV